MTATRSADYLAGLVRELCGLTGEVEWVELKHNKANPQEIGEYIRIGEVKKPLKEAPDRERALWRIFDQTPFEELIAAERQDADTVLRLLDYPAYLDLLELPFPSNRDGILEALAGEHLIHRCEAGGWNITNLGAMLFAKRLDEFRTLLTNASLRERFGVEERNKAAVSRYIREAVEAGAIKPFDEDAARKLMKYVPSWA